MVWCDDIIAATAEVAAAAELFSEVELGKVIKATIALNRVAVQNPVKYDYEVAMTGSPLIALLSKGWERLGSLAYRDLAIDTLNACLVAWRKYGFFEKAENLEKLFVGLKA